MPTLPTDLSIRPLRRAEYDHMVDAGLLVDEPIELLDGMLVEMSPEGDPHSRMIQELNWHLARALPEGVRVRIGHPWVASDISEPEPDVAVVPYREERGHPTAAILLIEVSHSSLMKDLAVKSRIYGAAGVPEYWVIDLVNDVVHVHLDPTDDGYGSIARRGFEDTLDAAGVPTRIADLLPDDAAGGR